MSFGPSILDAYEQVGEYVRFHSGWRRASPDLPISLPDPA